MRDFRDAKAMAQTLRYSLGTKAVTISHSECLELVSKMFGAADWNTLSALIQGGRRAPGAVTAPQTDPERIYPAIAIRDLAPFPSATFPLFVGRERTFQALDHAFQRQREVALVVQKQSEVDEPGTDDVYDIGVLAGVLDLIRLTDGTAKVLTQAYRRIRIRRLFGETGAYLADIADISEGAIPEAPELIESAVLRFKAYATAHNIGEPPLLDQLHDPGRVADIICTHIKLPIAEKQGLLATLDPVARLERAYALMDAKV
jgi:ATP-dependent Lon protease